VRVGRGYLYPNPHYIILEKLLPVRSEVAGLLTGVESFRIRDSACHVSYHIVTTRTELGLVE
jgi:hypothetical protein